MGADMRGAGATTTDFSGSLSSPIDPSFKVILLMPDGTAAPAGMKCTLSAALDAGPDAGDGQTAAA